MRPHTYTWWHTGNTVSALVGAFALAVASLGCAHTAPAKSSAAPSLADIHWGTLQRTVRVTGSIVPAEAATLAVPQLNQQDAQLTLAFIAPSGSKVTKGQVLAAFDRTQLEDTAAEAHTQYTALASQVKQQQAQMAAQAAQQTVALTQAQQDERTARLELSKGPVLTALEIATNKVKLADATAHVKSLKAADAWLTQQAQAKLHALVLQQQEQKRVWQRAQADSSRMLLRAPMAGMMTIALPPFAGKPVPGMKLYTGMPLVRVFDPSRMLVDTRVSDVDLAWVPPGAKAQVRIDAYPGLVLPAHLLRLNPVAVDLLGTPIHDFNATFALDASNPRALPDLNASLEITSSPRTGWLVPRTDVQYQNGRAYVRGRGASGQRQLRPVDVEVFSGPWIEIAAPWLGPAPAMRSNR